MRKGMKWEKGETSTPKTKKLKENLKGEREGRKGEKEKPFTGKGKGLKAGKGKFNP